MGAKRVSLLLRATFDARNMAPKRNMTISDSIGRAPWVRVATGRSMWARNDEVNQPDVSGPKYRPPPGLRQPLRWLMFARIAVVHPARFLAWRPIPLRCLIIDSISRSTK
jgi:hypothetical protein